MDTRKVLITDGFLDTMLLITDAPREDIEEWCRQYNKDLGFKNEIGIYICC